MGLKFKVLALSVAALAMLCGSNVFAQSNRVGTGDDASPRQNHNPLNAEANFDLPGGEAQAPKQERKHNPLLPAADKALDEAGQTADKKPARPTVEINDPPQPDKNVKPKAVQIQAGTPPQAVPVQAAVAVTRQNYPVPGQYKGAYVPPAGVSYYTSFYYGGFAYRPPAPFFAFNGYAPTQWFYYGAGAWYAPGNGWQFQPPVFRGVITIVRQETIVQAVWNPALRRFVPVARTVVFYYHAYWYQAAGAYGYYDYAGQFHWVRW